MKYITFFFVAFAAIMTYESCILNGTNGGNTTCYCDNACTQYFKIKTPTISNVRVDTTAPATTITEIGTGSMTNRSFGWFTQFSTENYCENKFKMPSLFPTATAIPAMPKMICKEKIDTFTVITVNDYDAAHLAGSQLNDILAIQWLFSGGQIDSIATTKTSLNAFMANVNRPVFSSSFVLFLRQAPASTRTVKAKIHIRLSNGQALDGDSQAITIYK